jgi:hypothetical protein
MHEVYLSHTVDQPLLLVQTLKVAFIWQWQIFKPHMILSMTIKTEELNYSDDPNLNPSRIMFTFQKFILRIKICLFSKSYLSLHICICWNDKISYLSKLNFLIHVSHYTLHCIQYFPFMQFDSHLKLNYFIEFISSQNALKIYFLYVKYSCSCLDSFQVNLEGLYKKWIYLTPRMTTRWKWRKFRLKEEFTILLES